MELYLKDIERRSDFFYGFASSVLPTSLVRALPLAIGNFEGGHYSLHLISQVGLESNETWLQLYERSGDAQIG